MMQKGCRSPSGLLSRLSTNASMIRSTTVSDCLRLLSFERNQSLGGQGISEGIQSCIFEHAVEIAEGRSHDHQGARTDRSFPRQRNVHTLLILSGMKLAAKTISVKSDESRTQSFRRSIPGTFLLN